MMRRRAAFLCASLLLAVALSPAGLGARGRDSGERIDDAAFWRMFTGFSEPSGYFQSDNLVSNERTFPAILPDLALRHSEQSAYVGVGPEQNFSYLAAVRPRIAFIVDIRRQNAILHLLYKALFEMAPNRAEFLSRLLSRERPRGLDSRSSVRDLFEGFARAPASPRRFAGNLKDVRNRLLKKHHFKLGDEDLGGLKYVYTAFFEAGPELQYSFGSTRRGRPFPTFADLMTATDESGVARSFLASEESYQAVRDLEERNLVIPVVGNFVGPKALKSVGTYLASRGFTVTVFYTSNVEMYLFRGEDWRGFYDNVAVLPADPRSVLVRSVFGGLGGFSGFGPASAAPGPGRPGRPGKLQIDPLQDLVATFRRGEITGYDDLIARVK
jgi:hypothetical protein